MFQQMTQKDKSSAGEDSAIPARQFRAGITAILFLLGIGYFLLGPGLRMAQAQSVKLYKNTNYTDSNVQTAFQWGATVHAVYTGTVTQRCVWLAWFDPSSASYPAVYDSTPTYNQRDPYLAIRVDQLGYQTAIQVASYTLPTGPPNTPSPSGIWEVQLWAGGKNNQNCSSPFSNNQTIYSVVQTSEFDVAKTVIIGAGTSSTTIADGLTPDGGDVTVTQGSPNLTHGFGGALVVAGSSQGTNERAFLRFDIAGAGIPSTATINNATVRLWMFQAPQYTAYKKVVYTLQPYTVYEERIYNLEEATQDWSEGTITWNNQGPTRTGANIDSVFNLTYPKITSTNVTLGALSNVYTRFSGNLKYHVRRILDGGETNYGYALYDADETGYCVVSFDPINHTCTTWSDVQVGFRSTESSDRGQWPVMLIDWDNTNPIVAPTAILTTKVLDTGNHNHASFPANTSVHDRATITFDGGGTVPPSSTVTFQLFNAPHGSCSTGIPILSANSQIATGLLSGNHVDSAPTGALSAGNYAYQATFTSGVPGELISPAAPTCTPFTVNKTDPTATLFVSNSPQTYTGSALTATVGITTSSVPGTVANIVTGDAASQTDQGTYPVYADFVPNDSADYNTLENLSVGDFVIDKAKSTVKVTGGTFTYDGTAHGANVSVTGAGGLYLTPTPTYSGTCSSAPLMVADGTTCTASYMYAGDDNHTGNSDSDTITITKAPATVTAGSYSDVYDGSAHSPSPCVVAGTYVGDMTCTNSPASVGPGMGSGTVTPVVGTPADASNFSITSTTNGSWSITKRPATVTTNNSSKYFGTPDPSPLTTATLDNFVDTVSSTFSRAAGEAPGNYAITTTLDATPSELLDNYSITNPGATFTILPDTTVLTYTGPTSSTYGQCGTINLSAVLMDTIHGVPVSGATITFMIGSQRGTAVTDSTGTANLSLNVDRQAGMVDVTAEFAGNLTLAPATSTLVPYTINPSTDLGPIAGKALYTGPTLVWTNSSTDNTATVALSTTVEDLAGCSGDISTSNVTFAIRNGATLTPIPSAQNLSVGLVSPTNPYIGTASRIVQLSTGNSTYAQFVIAVIFGGNYNLNNPAYDQIITVAQPGQAASIVGGGAVDLNAPLPAAGFLATGAGTQSSAIPTGISNYLQVSAGVAYNKSFKNPHGSVILEFNSYNRPDGTVDFNLHTYQITSNSIAGLTAPVTGQVFQFTAKCNIVDITDPASPINVDGGATMQVTTYNSGYTDSNQVTYPNGAAIIEVQPKAGGLWIAAGWNGTQPRAKSFVNGGIVGQ